MDFFDIGPLEILLILVIALIVFGPDKLPQIAASIGKGIRKLKEATTELSKEFQEAAGEVKDAGKETGGTATPEGGLAKDFGEVAKEIKDVAREINADLKTDVGLTGESTEVGRRIQDAAKETSVALKPDVGLPRESTQAAEGATEGMGGVAEGAPGAVGPVRSAKETDGGSGWGEEKL
jgi:TatA/E family protein of Tat protein translocase